MDRERPSIEERTPRNPNLEEEGILLPKKYSIVFIGLGGVGKSSLISNILQSRGISSKATVSIGAPGESEVHGTVNTTVIPTTKHSFIIDTMGISGFQKSDDIHNWWQLSGNIIREILYNPVKLEKKLKYRHPNVPHPQLVVFISKASYYLPERKMETNARGRNDIDQVIKKRKMLQILIAEWTEKTNFIHNAIVVLTHADQLTPEEREIVLQHAPKEIGLEKDFIKLVSNVDVDEEENNFFGPKRVDNLLEECFEIIDVNLNSIFVDMHKNNLHIKSAWYYLTNYPKYKKDVTENVRSLVKNNALHLDPGTFFNPGEFKKFGEFNVFFSRTYEKTLHVEYYYRGALLEEKSTMSEGFHIP